MNSSIVGVEECSTVTTTKDDWIKSYKEVMKNQKQGIENDVKMQEKSPSLSL